MKYGYIVMCGCDMVVLVCIIVYGKSYGKKFKYGVFIFCKGYFEMVFFFFGEIFFVVVLIV